jgi:hypothetical protein
MADDLPVPEVVDPLADVPDRPVAGLRVVVVRSVSAPFAYSRTCTTVTRMPATRAGFGSTRETTRLPPPSNVVLRRDASGTSW